MSINYIRELCIEFNCDIWYKRDVKDLGLEYEIIFKKDLNKIRYIFTIELKDLMYNEEKLNEYINSTLRDELERLTKIEKYVRPSWDRYYMNIAIETAKRSTCDRLSVGCVIVKNNRIISTGYNGSVSGFDHCLESGHLFNKEGRCIRTVHAEQNAILFAGDSLNGATCYVTHYPCEHCSKLLAQAGISRLVYDKDYNNEHSKYFLQYIDVCKIKEE